jgi:predicted alpha/beta superfamily hydrolase
MKNLLLTGALWLLASLSYGQDMPEKLREADFSIGKTVTIQSKVLGEARELNIYLPLGYSGDSAQTFPVIYLLDGSRDEDFIHISGIVQFGSFSWIRMIPESIVVGIGNVDRKRDFTYPFAK